METRAKDDEERLQRRENCRVDGVGFARGQDRKASRGMVMEKSCPHCGGILTKARSGPDHRRFFALISAAFAHWPEAHEFQPDSPEHLRRWLTCKAGYRESIPILLPEDADPQTIQMFHMAIEATISACEGEGFVVPYRSGVAIIKAKSIAWDKLGQREFAEVRSAVEDVIKAETGFEADKLLSETERAA